jgi:hypothetical protein
VLAEQEAMRWKEKTRKEKAREKGVKKQEASRARARQGEELEGGNEEEGGETLQKAEKEKKNRDAPEAKRRQHGKVETSNTDKLQSGERKLKTRRSHIGGFPSRIRDETLQNEKQHLEDIFLDLNPT